jgi:NAD-dependent SIR2 family protein deacetylase
MQRSNYLRRAANLYTRAAHAFVEGNNEQEALGYARTALELFSQHKMPRRQRKFFTNITRRMTDKGMQASSQVLQKEYGTQITAQPAELQQEIHKPRGLLPTSCPKCGGAVASDEVDWVDDRTARCEYCGTLIRTEN